MSSKSATNLGKEMSVTKIYQNTLPNDDRMKGYVYNDELYFGIAVSSNRSWIIMIVDHGQNLCIFHIRDHLCIT